MICSGGDASIIQGLTFHFEDSPLPLLLLLSLGSQASLLVNATAGGAPQATRSGAGRRPAGMAATEGPSYH